MKLATLEEKELSLVQMSFNAPLKMDLLVTELETRAGSDKKSALVIFNVCRRVDLVPYCTLCLEVNLTDL